MLVLLLECSRVSYVGRPKPYNFSCFGFLLFAPSAALKQLATASRFDVHVYAPIVIMLVSSVIPYNMHPLSLIHI